MIVKAGGKKNHLAFEIEEYDFKDFTTAKKAASSFEVRPYQLPSMSKVIKREEQKNSGVIMQERKFAAEKEFSISPIILKHRGIKRMEIEEYEKKTELEVQRRVEKIKGEWEIKGYEEGKKNGHDEVVKENHQKTLDQIAVLHQLVSEVIATKEEIIIHQKQQLMDLIRSLTKWVILKEINADGQYMGRLLEKLILELGTKENLIIKVNKDYLQGMDEMLELIQEKLGELKNVRLEIDYDQERPGIVIESQNGIIDGSFEAQMENLDKLFVNVVENVNE